MPGRAGLSAAANPVLRDPNAGATVLGFDPVLSWSNPNGATQTHLQVLPASFDGPGLDLYSGSPATSFRIPAPTQWYGLLPDMTYVWRVRVGYDAESLDLNDPRWGPWILESFCTPKVNSETITADNPPLRAVVSSLRPILRWSNTQSGVSYKVYFNNVGERA